MAGPIPSAGPHLGRVTSFDPKRGLGTVAELETAVEFSFHATAIADGTRAIDVATVVAFTVAPGHGGRDEAQFLVKLEPTLFADTAG
jgi:cold shock CspA family protein